MAEIYEEEGNKESALETYALIIDSFRSDPALVERAKERATALETQK